MTSRPSEPDVVESVRRALAEDLGSGDITAGLIEEPDVEGHARLTVREPAVICGSAWFDEVYRQVDPAVSVDWRLTDGDAAAADSVVCTITGPAQSILSGERTALNFLQTLSGTATAARRFVEAVAGTQARILDTRKTIPGLRLAQKYAVRCGGAHNHRIGLFDAYLIKENHIAMLGSVSAAVARAAGRNGNRLIEIEVENLEQLKEALDTAAHRLMLDNFSIGDMRAAIALRDAHGGERKELEASGNVTLETVRSIAETGVDWISVGQMTKSVRAIDYSLRFAEAGATAP